PPRGDPTLSRARSALAPAPATYTAAAGWPRRCKRSIGWTRMVRRGSRVTSCESKFNSCCSQVDRSALAPRRTDDEMSEVPLLELRTRAALQTLRLLVFAVRT